MSDGMGRGVLPWMHRGCQNGCGEQGSVIIEEKNRMVGTPLRAWVCEKCAATVMEQTQAWRIVPRDEPSS